MLPFNNIRRIASDIHTYSSYNKIKFLKRTFLSQSYYCNEVWDNRLKHPLLQKVNLDELYFKLDQRFQKTKQISAVDVNIFANAISDSHNDDELLDLVHKLRLSAESCKNLEGTNHALIRTLLKNGKNEELVNIIDDRLNYGIFLDHYTGNILLDTFWNKQDYVSGARVIAQFMLQEDIEHPITFSLGLLHCYTYIVKNPEWPKRPKPEEPEEEVKVRVKYLRNEYFDNHFDLEDPLKIVGKTLIYLTKNTEDTLSKSFNLLGFALFENWENVRNKIELLKKGNLTLIKEVLDLLPEESVSKKLISSLKSESVDVNKLLFENVKNSLQSTAEKDVQSQLEVFQKWENERVEALEEQKARLEKLQRLENVEEIKKQLKEKEEKLWFFENEEQIELDIEAKKKYYPKRWFGKKKKPKKLDENYIPPEV